MSNVSKGFQDGASHHRVAHAPPEVCARKAAPGSGPTLNGAAPQRTARCHQQGSRRNTARRKPLSDSVPESGPRNCEASRRHGVQTTATLSGTSATPRGVSPCRKMTPKNGLEIRADLKRHSTAARRPLQPQLEKRNTARRKPQSESVPKSSPRT